MLSVKKKIKLYVSILIKIIGILNLTRETILCKFITKE